MEEFLTTRQIQALLKVDRITIYRMINDGRLHGVKIGQQWRFHRPEVDRLLGGQAPGDRAILEESHPVFPVHCAQTIQDLFSAVGQIDALILDSDGTPVTHPSMPCSFCKLMQSSPSGLAACQATWEMVFTRSTQGETKITCHAGLDYDFAPIIEDSKVTGVALVGPHYGTEKSRDQITQVNVLANRHLLAADDLQRAVHEVPVIKLESKAQVEKWPALISRAIQSILTERSSFMLRLKQIADLTQIQ